MKNSYNIIVNLIKTFIFVTVAIILIFIVGRVLEYKTSRYYKMPLFEIADQVDVLIAGPSHSHQDVYPYYLWKNYGITSYNVASSGEHMQVTYYVLKDLLKTVHPKVIVLDASRAINKTDETIEMTDGLVHESMDYMPYTKDRAELAKFAADSFGQNPIAFLSNMYAYHNRWKELQSSDFVKEYTKENGASMKAGISPADPFCKYEVEYDAEVKTWVGYRYLSKIFDLCDEQDIELLVVNFPYAKDTEKKQVMEYSYKCETINRGYSYLDYLDVVDEINFDVKMDFADAGHTNMVGAKKVTNYLGEYLMREYSLQDHRLDGKFDYWNAFEKNYDSARIENAEHSNEALDMIMYMYDSEKYNIELYSTKGVILGDKNLELYIKERNLEIQQIDAADEDTYNSVIGYNNGFYDYDFAVVIRNTLDNSIELLKVFKFYSNEYCNS